jgi:CRP/FNR family transcriptional regulator
LSERIYNSDIFRIPLTQEDLGNLVDSSRESISRVLTEFEKDGIIKLAGKKVEIANKKSLLLISANG